MQAAFILPPDYLRGEVVLLYATRAPSDRVQSAFANLIRPQLVADASPEVQDRVLKGPGGWYSRPRQAEWRQARAACCGCCSPLRWRCFWL